LAYSAASFSETTVTAHKLLLPPSADIAATIADCGKKEDHYFASAFRKRRNQEADRGWELLEQIFSFLFRAGNASEPFGPVMQVEGRRSMIPDDLTDPQLDALAATLSEIDDPEYRARISDVLWLRQRDPTAARVAVENYLATGSRLEDPEHWTASIERYERAVRLARQVESKGELPKRILAHLEGRVRHYDGQDPLYFSLKALHLLEEFAFGDFAKLAEIAGRVAAVSRAARSFDRARSYYDIQARLLKRSKQQDAAEAARVSRAECFCEEADEREKGGSFMAARVFWEKAVAAFRERPALRPRVQEMQKRLAIAGKNTLDEMQPHQTEIDLSEPIARSQKAIAGQPSEDAFFTLLTFLSPMDPARLREQVLESMRTHPLQWHFDQDMFDAAGRKVGKRPAVSSDPERYETTVRGFMEQQASLERSLRLHGYIAPGLRQLLSEHEIDELTIESLIGDSKLIPEGRLPLFVQGIAAGFRWDFLTALHLLIPQVENGLREMLTSLGVTPRNMDPEGIEEVWSYERILSHKATKETLGEPLVFDLESLLVGRLGPNFRNLVAHGLLSHDALNSEVAVYLWWLLLRLTALPTRKLTEFIQRQQQSTSSAGTEAKADSRAPLPVAINGHVTG
jgi:hypothetical protein